VSTCGKISINCKWKTGPLPAVESLHSQDMYVCKWGMLHVN